MQYILDDDVTACNGLYQNVNILIGKKEQNRELYQIVSSALRGPTTSVNSLEVLEFGFNVDHFLIESKSTV